MAEGKVDGRTLRYAHRRPELLLGAAEYVLDHGVGDLSLRPMAAALGVSHTTLIRHFGTKEALLAEIIDLLLARQVDYFEHDERFRAVESAADLGRAFWSLLVDEPAERRQFILLAELYAIGLRHQERYGPLLEKVVDDFVAFIQMRLAADGLPASETSALASAVLALLRGLQLDLVATGDVERTTEAFDLGLRALLDR